MSTDFTHNETSIQPIDSGSESAFIGSWSSSSSSSFLTTSFGSELDSNDADLDDTGDGDEFIAELTRRMADYMFEENDDVTSLKKREFQEPVENKNHEQTRRSYADTVKKSLAGAQSEQNFTGNEPLQLQSQSQPQLQPPIQLYQVENQPRVGGRGRKGKMSESTQHVKAHRHEQMYSNRSYRGSKEFVNGGSGMRAIFLGGSGSRNVMSGTGVFLPRSSTDATDHSRKKSGCSTVLVPTRVLQALEQHFNNIESLSPFNLAPQTHHVNKEKTQTQEAVAVDHQDPKLPQDWIY
ncbi:hypothetical protein HanRHA438_Chr06g0269991 [Helianthus annuus]|uniref:Uncharacterized protein n=1 Tax=Helianthus annuus TaxID=4232 RepID=A0A251U292_HELAN|nr:uncharacterized protein LOC110871976 [Helianthus annuus]KAF5802563.1 hypothetical protein HanXRQr2_Chr06g0260941 [Helianthus annuus]KAJ0560668.1 hypothetical protein HanHA300_Chr06g0213931 [Helianthus annuus]KAJ0573704.1 hypothetical protein HanHA89_Chr06g0229701 [Helianthus annuus]KAJ0740932.1 hypothetical protein HanOQP8_Chr06g0222241 [Helianthus annuus]KAJ0912055.1 hypothetical protein HanRHA438_Chr06g0269991 [Helianthus annuus]